MAIKAGELIKYDRLNEEIEVNLIDDDIKREAEPTIGYYAMFEYLNGFRKTMYWTKQQMIIHADTYSQAFNLNAVKNEKNPEYSRQSYNDYMTGLVPEKELWKYSSFWYKDFDGMAFKTMLRQLISKWGIMSIEMQQAFESDDSIINADKKPEYVDGKSSKEPTQSEMQPDPNAPAVSEDDDPLKV